MAIDLRYTLLMFGAILLGSALLRRSQARLPLAWWQKLGLGLGAFCGAFLGAKLPFVLYNWQDLSSGPVWFADGKTIMFGIVGGYLGVEVTKWALEIRIRTGDSFAIPVALSVAVGRLACFFGGCCFGCQTSLPWGVNFPNVAGPRHPTQLYEFAFHLMAVVLLWQCERRGLFRCQRIKLYILAYLVFRFFTEFLRPEPHLALQLTAYQWAALALLPVFAALWWQTAWQLRREQAHESLAVRTS